MLSMFLPMAVLWCNIHRTLLLHIMITKTLGNAWHLTELVNMVWQSVQTKCMSMLLAIIATIIIVPGQILLEPLVFHRHLP